MFGTLNNLKDIVKTVVWFMQLAKLAVIPTMGYVQLHIAIHVHMLLMPAACTKKWMSHSRKSRKLDIPLQQRGTQRSGRDMPCLLRYRK